MHQTIFFLVRMLHITVSFGSILSIKVLLGEIRFPMVEEENFLWLPIKMQWSSYTKQCGETIYAIVLVNFKVRRKLLHGEKTQCMIKGGIHLLA